jgi:hypothetical protein
MGRGRGALRDQLVAVSYDPSNHQLRLRRRCQAVAPAVRHETRIVDDGDHGPSARGTDRADRASRDVDRDARVIAARRDEQPDLTVGGLILDLGDREATPERLSRQLRRNGWRGGSRFRLGVELQLAGHVEHATSSELSQRGRELRFEAQHGRLVAFGAGRRGVGRTVGGEPNPVREQRREGPRATGRVDERARVSKRSGHLLVGFDGPGDARANALRSERRKIFDRGRERLEMPRGRLADPRDDIANGLGSGVEALRPRDGAHAEGEVGGARANGIAEREDLDPGVGDRGQLELPVDLVDAEVAEPGAKRRMNRRARQSRRGRVVAGRLGQRARDVLQGEPGGLKELLQRGVTRLEQDRNLRDAVGGLRRKRATCDGYGTVAPRGAERNPTTEGGLERDGRLLQLRDEGW